MMRVLLSVLLGLALTACCMQAAKPAAQQRIVVLGSYIAEIVVALGGADQVAGVSGGTDHIGELKGAPRLPGFRQSSAENILALQPTMVLLSADVSAPGIADQLRAAGVRVEVFAADPTLAGVEARIAQVGAALGKPQEAQNLLTRYRADLADAKALVARAASRPRGVFILSGGNRPTLIGGSNTGVGALIELAGGENAASAVDGFKVMSQEAMVEAAPEFLLVNPDGLADRGGVPAALTAPGAQLTPAARQGRIISLPGEYLQGLGLLTPEAMRRLARAIHPELAHDAAR